MGGYGIDKNEIMKKDFDSWNNTKKEIEESSRDISFKERSVWWCSLGVNIGHEQDGKNDLYERPVLIIRKFSKLTCLCVPLTTSLKMNKFHIALPSFSKDTYAISSQIRLISTKRLQREMGFVNRKDFRILKEVLHKMIG
jgi:mRNA interferase MazF